MQIFGHPNISAPNTFVPQSKVGAKHPPYQGRVCHGWDMSGNKADVLKKIDNKLQIKYLIQAYKAYPDKKHFFSEDMHEEKKMSLANQISSGMSEKEIRASWEPRLSEFKKIRKKYLIYPDFE